MGRLQDKVALVSGAGRGIGRATALKLAGEGARVVVNDLDEQPLAEVVSEIEKGGGKAASYPGDVTNPAFGERFVEIALSRFGGLDIIVNNAGYTWDNVIQKMTPEQFDAILGVHLRSPFLVLRAAAEFIREASKREAAEGRELFRKVVNVSSISGTRGNAGQINYAAAKAGVVGLTKALAKEWGRYKVNVNAVAFGYIVTRMTQAVAAEGATINIGGRTLPVGLSRDRVDQAARLVPLGRGGTPEEAAGAIYLLTTPESNYISGQCIEVTGGM